MLSQRALVIFFLIQFLYAVVNADLKEVGSSKDLPDNEDLERRHRKRRPHHNNNNNNGGGGLCGLGGYGKTFGFHKPSDYTYVSAPVMNYYFGCGLATIPVAAPVAAPAAPVYHQPPIYPQPGFGGFGHHNHNHNHNFGGGPQGGHFGPQGPNGPQRPFRPQYQDFGNRPFGMVVNSAASSFGTALADYIGGNRPKKVYKQFNRQVNQLFKPLYKLF